MCHVIRSANSLALGGNNLKGKELDRVERKGVHRGADETGIRETGERGRKYHMH